MLTADEILTEARKALSHHETEAARLRAMIAAAEGRDVVTAAPFVLPAWIVPPVLNPMYPIGPLPPWRYTPLGPQDHGGMCACSQCVTPTLCATWPFPGKLA